MPKHFLKEWLLREDVGAVDEPDDIEEIDETEVAQRMAEVEAAKSAELQIGHSLDTADINALQELEDDPRGYQAPEKGNGAASSRSKRSTLDSQITSAWQETITFYCNRHQISPDGYLKTFFCMALRKSFDD